MCEAKVEDTTSSRSISAVVEVVVPAVSRKNRSSGADDEDEDLTVSLDSFPFPFFFSPEPTRNCRSRVVTYNLQNMGINSKPDLFL